MNIEKHKAFLDSLDMKKEQGEGQLVNEFEWVETEPLLNVAAWQNQPRTSAEYYRVVERLLRRCRRAESREVPDLKEKVKAAMLAAMDAVEDAEGQWQGEYVDLKNEFRLLCAPEEVKP